MITSSAESNEFDPSLPRRENVTLPAWVNDPLPPWNEILTAHDVARLTRRHRWMLSALMLVGQFPQQHRYQGRPIGWHWRDVIAWMSRNLAVSDEARNGQSPTPRCSALRRSRRVRQLPLSLEHTAFRVPERARRCGRCGRWRGHES